MQGNKNAKPAASNSRRTAITRATTWSSACVASKPRRQPSPPQRKPRQRATMLIPKPKVTVERLREALSYDPATGRLEWKVRISCHNPGEHAGCVKMDGYVYVNLDKNRMFGHRIAWALHYGRWPDHQLDHINGVRSDNKLANLREVTNSVNQHNRRDMVRKNGSLKGTSFS